MGYYWSISGSNGLICISDRDIAIYIYGYILGICAVCIPRAPYINYQL